MSDVQIRLLADAVILITIVEALFLVAYHRLTGRGLAPRDYALNLAAGFCLMLALRFALTGASGLWVALCLSAAGLAHGADIWRRWTRRT